MWKSDAFTPEKKSIGHFFILLAILSALLILADITTQIYVHKGEPWSWQHITFQLLLLIPTIIAYFIARLLAYRTSFMATTSNRQGLHVACFFILLVVLIAVTIVIL